MPYKSFVYEAVFHESADIHSSSKKRGRAISTPEFISWQWQLVPSDTSPDYEYHWGKRKFERIQGLQVYNYWFCFTTLFKNKAVVRRGGIINFVKKFARTCGP